MSMMAAIAWWRPRPIASAPSRSIWRRLLQHRGSATGIAIMTVLLLLCLVGPLVLPHEPNWPSYADALQGPNSVHWLGTDATGRDVFSRLLDGAHRSLGAAALVLTCLFSIGLVLGTVAGLSGGMVDMLLMRLVDLMMTLPGLVLAFAILGILGPGFHNLLLALVIADWAYYARITRAYVLTAAGREDVIAARLAGIPRWRIVFGHILPGVAAQLGVVASLGLGGMVGAISSFSFLGLGVQPPHAEWGAMLSESRFYFAVAPWLLLAPAGTIFLAVAAANLIGNGLRDVLDPGVAP